jgi:hypothetical protein
MTMIAAAEFSVEYITINSTSKKAAFVTAKDAISEIKNVRLTAGITCRG